MVLENSNLAQLFTMESGTIFISPMLFHDHFQLVFSIIMCHEDDNTADQQWPVE